MMRVYVALIAFFSFISWTSSHIVHYTSSGGVCTNTCGYHGNKYTWCQQKGGSGHGWDYCSLKEGLAVSGEKCDSPCDLWGGSYHYCYFRNGKWNYCSILSEWDSFEYSLKNNSCKNHCRITEGHFQCETIHGLEPCSPFRDVTPTGLPCHINYQCAKYGCSAYHCQTGKGEDDWDLCRPKDNDGCIWKVSVTNTTLTEICTLVYSQKKSNIFFRREMQTKIVSPTKEQFKDAVHLIDNLNTIRNFSEFDAPSKMYFYKESILCNGINYTSVKLWLNNNTNKTIAHVIFSEILSIIKVLHLAFYTSLHSAFYSPAYTIIVSVGEPMLCSIDY
ncbi:uncharacterized protein LOC131198526 [Ahaetulla prasina]|uniref:uncharacterized protein LOC131198526 n=1 Tax=Ahaetulla prasina TaxID=499056 RepID=UPI00264834B0|nr:uncharacterized protein LOC131198526 [Ahaetulla prasina]XP_058039254.1 uncharacterized protein LOC131198526 [Ahaetulla prasina]XP_058039255.1 uncharacterized protein LOC131198526 [Ahaetulla prasina]